MIPVTREEKYIENVKVKEQVPEIHYRDVKETVPVERTKISWDTVSKSETAKVISEKQLENVRLQEKQTIEGKKL